MEHSPCKMKKPVTILPTRFPSSSTSCKNRAITLTFNATARELVKKDFPAEESDIPVEIKEYLKSTRFIPTDGKVREIASSIEGVMEIEKCRIRKSGLGLLMDIHVVVLGDISVREGHIIGHEVKDHLLNSDLKISDVTVHVEPGSLTKQNR